MKSFFSRSRRDHPQPQPQPISTPLKNQSTSSFSTNTPTHTPCTTATRSTFFHSPNSSTSSYELLPTPVSLSHSRSGSNSSSGVGVGVAKVSLNYKAHPLVTSSTSDIFDMGQNNGRMEHLDSASCTPSTLSPSLAQPDFYHAPHSAPVIPTAPKHNTLTRALSAKRRDRARPATANAAVNPPPPMTSVTSKKALRTLGHDLKSDMRQFENLVLAAETSSTSGHSSPSDSSHNANANNTTKSSTRHSSIGRSRARPSTATPGQPTSPSRPIPIHRRSSLSASPTGSIHSRGSIKSARRAEREWRAKVAAMSSSFDRRSSVVELRGPVPPRRTPAMARVMAQSSDSASNGPSELIPIAQDSTSPAKSFVSRRSFETLGHYIHTEGEDTRLRKPSVPHSAVSSFYVDPNGTRPSSLATSQLLLQPPASPRSLEIPPPAESSDESIHTPNTPHKAFLPPFQSFQDSPTLVSQANLPSSTESRDLSPVNWEAENRSISLRRSEPDLRSTPELTDPKFLSLPSRANSESVHTDDATDTISRCPAPPPSPAAPRRALPIPLTLKETTSSPVPVPMQTPTRSITTDPSTPNTPYSPMTAYILTAPSIENLAWSGTFAFDLSSSPMFASGSQARPSPSTQPDVEPSTPVHPFAAFKPDATSPEAPLPPSKSPEHVPRRVPTTTPARQQSSSSAALGTPSDPFSRVIPGSSAKPSLAMTMSKSKSTSSSLSRKTPPALALRPKQLFSTKSNASPHDLKKHKKEIVGTNVSTPRGKLDLTPGMESGHRPPKSGLPMADLERWLASSSISA